MKKQLTRRTRMFHKRLRKKYTPRNKIDNLPEALYRELKDKLMSGHFHSYKELEKWTAEQGHRITAMALWKKHREFQTDLQAIREATEQAGVLAEMFDNRPEEMPKALVQLVQTELFKLLKEVKVASKPIWFKSQFNTLCRTIGGIVKTGIDIDKWSADRKERISASVAKARHEIDNAPGLSEETADRLRAALLEIVEVESAPSQAVVINPEVSNEQTIGG